MSADENGELPEGWARTLFSELADITSGVTKGQKRRITDSLRKVPYLRVANVQRGYLDLTEVKEIDATEREIQALCLVPGDILLIEGGNREHLGRGWIWEGQLKECIHQNHVFRARLRHRGMQPKFISWYANQIGQSYFEAEASQTVNLASINLKALSRLPVAIPPLAEQRRIVAAVEAVLAKVNAARDRLNRVPSILKRFRQAVLSAACSGRLTADWREKYPNPPSTGDLAPEDAPEVPGSWEWETLGKIANVKGGVTKGRKIPASEQVHLPYLRVANVQDGYLDLREVKEIVATEGDRTKYALQVGDILFIEGGNREHLGRGAVWHGEVPGCIHQNHIFRARLQRQDVLSDFVSLVTKSTHARDYFFANASQTVNLASINLRMLSALPVPLPPLPEQQEIVRRVEKLFALADVIEARLADTRQMADQLTQAVLAKAFRGELVPTEAALARRENRTYEPAADLLARIRADREKTAAPATKPTRPRKPKTGTP